MLSSKPVLVHLKSERNNNSNYFRIPIQEPIQAPDSSYRLGIQMKWFKTFNLFYNIRENVTIGFRSEFEHMGERISHFSTTTLTPGFYDVVDMITALNSCTKYLFQNGAVFPLGPGQLPLAGQNVYNLETHSFEHDSNGNLVVVDIPNVVGVSLTPDSQRLAIFPPEGYMKNKVGAMNITEWELTSLDFVIMNVTNGSAVLKTIADMIGVDNETFHPMEVGDRKFQRCSLFTIYTYTDANQNFMVVPSSAGYKTETSTNYWTSRVPLRYSSPSIGVFLNGSGNNGYMGGRRGDLLAVVPNTVSYGNTLFYESLNPFQAISTDTNITQFSISLRDDNGDDLPLNDGSFEMVLELQFLQDETQFAGVDVINPIQDTRGNLDPFETFSKRPRVA